MNRCNSNLLSGPESNSDLDPDPDLSLFQCLPPGPNLDNLKSNPTCKPNSIPSALSLKTILIPKVHRAVFKHCPHLQAAPSLAKPQAQLH